MQNRILALVAAASLAGCVDGPDITGTTTEALAADPYERFRAFDESGNDVYGVKGFATKDGLSHGGVEPYNPPTADEKPDYSRIRVLAEVLQTKFAGMESRWYFAAQDDAGGRWKKGQLIGFEVTPDRDDDPCEVCLSEYKDYGDRQLPSKLSVRKGDKRYGDFTLTGVTLK